ncbi:MAG: nucleoside phosphorylase [Bradymonadales bacterium]|nr:nucleoside phosphorylase [Bradymonadales bacterium]
MDETIPLLWGHPDDEPVFTAREFIDYLDRYQGREMFSIPPDVVITFVPNYDRDIEGVMGQPDERWSGIKLYCRDGRKLAFSRVGVGAAMAASELEELIERGARRIIAVGSGGAIQPDLSVGDVLVLDRAIRDEGTSFHYLKPSWEVAADPTWVTRVAQALKRHGIPARIGRSWTTDAPYRETKRKLFHFQQEGVLAVEMEASALLAVAQVRGVQLVSVLIVSDLLGDGRWQPHFLDSAYRERRQPVFRAVLDAFRDAPSVGQTSPGR